ncbi:PREDICTED: laccase-3-like isoform X2 [Prunus mume]|uniref:Laccase-3-like isoform X2 n=1 Tax=Prunus mume TaxID=102107 RepID=A0ABM1LRH4_PRUMU|nr:PREDICTED: laccase-3-like isoform X2 [Prunus mume]
MFHSTTAPPLQFLNTTATTAPPQPLPFRLFQITITTQLLKTSLSKGNTSGGYATNFPDVPPYFYNFTGDVANNTLYPSFGMRVRMINYGEGVEIVFQGTSIIAPENHRMHLHGFSLYLVGTGFGNFNSTMSPTTYNLVDPTEVNTIGVPKNGWAAIRFVADNP